ncbi:FAD-dependent oxidoreductase [Paracoccus sp. Z118]|uniref:NAD(P)/FAD-dependent oxidoreductase n=1 Tax=Paracoccus sp. Z118 TaxID=2851017 RepID=UPI001C2BC654|nr:FAD-dependent oxidoreductase [Paracoccus sp. Z118]MBV0892569.1 FAD-dependent oxidoreductase [Paracoccus sp. Z118]
MIENEEDVIANSLWTATANPAPDCPPLRGKAECDVAVIGAGYTGLSAALHLAERGQRVIVLETHSPGWGASGRNGGQVNPGLKEDPDTIEARFGPDVGGRMVAMSGGAGQFVFDLIARLGIDCDARQSGWLQPVHNDKADAVVRRRVEQWTRRGAALRMLDRETTAALLGTDIYRGAMIDERGGNLHPLNYALGLADAAIRAGAVIHGGSRVTAHEAQGGEHLLRTSGGEVRARKVLVCTNGYSSAVVPPMDRTVVPIRSVQVATDILPPEIAARILPQGHSASDARRLLLYFRKDAAGRFVMGGRGNYSAGATRRQMQVLQDASVKLYPDLREVPWRYAWGGFVAMTADHYPHLNRVAPGVVAAMGYNGRGVAVASAMGKVLADWATGTPQGALDYPVSPPRPIPFHFMRKPAVIATVAWSRLQDRLGR